MLDYVIEHIDKLELSSDDQLDLFRILAEMCPFCTEFDQPKERLGKLFHVLMVRKTEMACEYISIDRFLSSVSDVFTRATDRLGNCHQWRHSGFSILLHRMFDVCITSIIQKISGLLNCRREWRARQRFSLTTTLSLSWRVLLYSSIKNYIKWQGWRRSGGGAGTFFALGFGLKERSMDLFLSLP